MSEPLAVLGANLTEDLARISRLFRRFPAYLDDFLTTLLGRNPDTVGEEDLGLSFQQLKENLTLLIKKENGSPLTDALLASLQPILSSAAAKAIAKRVQVESYLEAVNSAPMKTAYFRNAYADLAYSRFAEELTDPTVVYLESLAAACEEVYAERAELVILPVESDRDGVLSTVKRLITQYELAPVYYVTVPTRDEGFIRFGLFAAAPLLPVGTADGIELLLFADTPDRLSELLTAANYLGVKLTALEVTEPAGGFAHTWHITFSFREADALSHLRILLQCEYPHHLLCGIFRSLS